MKERTVKFLEKQLALAAEREKHLLEQVNWLTGQIVQLSDQLNLLTVQISEQTNTIESLRESLLQKGNDVSSLSGKNRGLAKLLSNTSEKVTPIEAKSQEPEKSSVSAKERGNNVHQTA